MLIKVLLHGKKIFFNKLETITTYSKPILKEKTYNFFFLNLTESYPETTKAATYLELLIWVKSKQNFTVINGLLRLL